MVIAWLRSLLIFDGFLAPEGTATVPTPEPTGESWFRQLLVLDGFLEAEREVQSVAQVPVEAWVSQVPTASLPAGTSENSESEITVASVLPESFLNEATDVPALSENLAPETTVSADEAETSAHCEAALTDWQRILGWKE